jgi:hypothetical protein
MLPKATEMAPIASTPVAPAVAEISFNFVVFTGSLQFRYEDNCEGVCFNPFAPRVTEASEGQTCVTWTTAGSSPVPHRPTVVPGP